MNMKTQTQIMNSKWWLTGFTDAEGTFHISIIRNMTYKFKWKISLSFSIKLHKKDIEILEYIQKQTNTGIISFSGNSCYYQVRDRKGLQIIIDHFTNYPLISLKSVDFLIFKTVFELILKGEHLTLEGISKIVALKANQNKGLSDDIKKAFPDVLAIPAPFYAFTGIPNPFWISGFWAGDGSFYVSITLTGIVRLFFGASLHIRDTQILIGLHQYLVDWAHIILKGSYIYTQKSASYNISHSSFINNAVIPFFDKHPILGTKSKDFEDFKIIAKMIKQKKHLTTEGLKKITEIRENMNLRRPY